MYDALDIATAFISPSSPSIEILGYIFCFGGKMKDYGAVVAAADIISVVRFSS